MTQLRNLFSRARHAPAAAIALAEAVLEGMPLETVEPNSFWPPQRIALAEELWGEGFLNPGGGAEVMRYAVPLGLSEAMSLLFVGVGSGGPLRVVASELGAWVSGYDADADLVAIAESRVQRAGAAVAKRVTVETWSPAKPHFRRRAFHHAIGFDALRDAAVDAVLAALHQAIKPGGQLALLELVADDALDPADPVVAAWCRLERRSPDLPSEATVADALQRLGFEVRVTEDQSSRHVGLVMQGWKGVIRGLQGAHPSHAYGAALVNEAELWMRRVGLIQSGRIRLVRWHAIAGRPG